MLLAINRDKDRFEKAKQQLSTDIVKPVKRAMGFGPSSLEIGRGLRREPLIMPPQQPAPQQPAPQQPQPSVTGEAMR